MNRAVPGAALIALVTLTAACAETTVATDPSDTTTAGITTTVPVGDPAELLARLQASAFVLSTAIAEGDGAGDRVIAEIDSLWAAFTDSEPRTQFVVSAENQLAIMRRAVERRRPADADKAARNLAALIDAR